jgi:hypothetical protein
MKINRTLLVLVTRLLLPEEPVLTHEEKITVEDNVVQYLATQIIAMPVYLKVPYIFALHVFNFLSLFRFGLPFTKINTARQVKYVRFWSQSRIGLMRDFIKLMRSCVLLAYLDHPLVLKELEASIRSSIAVESQS